MRKYFLVRLLVFEIALLDLISLSLTTLLYFGIIQTNQIYIASLIVGLINISALSFIVTRHYKKHGLFLGILTGVIYIAISFIVRLLTDGSFDLGYLMKNLILLITSMATGCVTINIINKD